MCYEVYHKLYNTRGDEVLQKTLGIFEGLEAALSFVSNIIDADIYNVQAFFLSDFNYSRISDKGVVMRKTVTHYDGWETFDIRSMGEFAHISVDAYKDKNNKYWRIDSRECASSIF